MAAIDNPRPMVIDLTHTVPTYRALAENPGRPDMGQPWSDIPPLMQPIWMSCRWRPRRWTAR